MKYQEVKVYCEENGFNHRKDQYVIMEKFFGISAGTIKDMMSFHRYLREILPVDEVGLAKEAEWHHTPATREAESWDSIFKVNGLNA